MPVGCGLHGCDGGAPHVGVALSFVLQSTHPTDSWMRFDSVCVLQVVRLGRFFMLSVPSEFTTMAGRRTRKAVHDEATPRCRTAHT